MDFALNDDQRAIQDAARAFAEDLLKPNSAEWDEHKTFPVDVMRQAAEMGFCGIYTSEDFGGTGLGRVEAAIIFEELARGDVATAAFISIHNMATWMVDRFGSYDLRQRYVPSLTTMEAIASYCLTEPGSGSDAAAMRTTARLEGDEWVLNGSKAFISGAGSSDVYVVMARTGEPGPKGISAFVVDKDAPGLSFGAQEKKMGWNAQPTAIVQFDDCRIPTANLLGKEGDGFRYAMMGLDGGRLNIAACSLGGSRLALETTLDYVKSRKQFGSALADFQNTQFKLADMATDLEAARLMVLRGAWAIDNDHPETTKWCAMAKRLTTDACFQIADEALQLHGGYGYLKDYPLERIVRDLRVHRILEGTNEIMRVITAREMLRQ
ncbi:isobutyryl-CoA dehydrogenase [Brevundimonas goettingensis]|uniref:Isobutyryl-CoA dehydrogenase n=1 Tax=Brevundimonas goettingensis TaxID=2774190 RepID=A0A975C297_9CAUL|nr:isobutyryl-CoA dehydrogenase [Brevundimonas goettingensis]QTC90247.1 isobutyryl-CoA dehydrogenase [Brevundimonas goettingensis]